MGELAPYGRERSICAAGGPVLTACRACARSAAWHTLVCMTDERLSAAGVAERINVKRPTWWAWVQRDRAPAPDGYDELSGWAWWAPATVDEFNADRAGWRARRRARVAS